MLEIRQYCENCAKPLPNDSDEAMICSYECTFCVTCVENILENVCPNCGGGLEKRPTRPKASAAKHPPSDKKIVKPVDQKTFAPLLAKNKIINPRQR